MQIDHDATFIEEASPGRITQAQKQLEGLIRRTPVIQWPHDDAQPLLGAESRIFLKLEALQHASCFKVRGALLTILNLPEQERERGVIAASAGNHAVSVAFAAQQAGVSAVVVVPKAASPARVALCRKFGAEVVQAGDIHAAFAHMQELREREGRTLIHSYDNPWMVLGAGTLAAEFLDEVDGLDAIVVSVGGGALCAGTAAAAQNLACDVYGVEPDGADTMTRSLERGHPQQLDQVRTIADSLAAPSASSRTLALCQRFAARVVRVSDSEIRAAGERLFQTIKLAVEPAAAAPLAAAVGPLKEELRGKTVGLIVCGSNLTAGEYAEFITASSSD